MRPGNRQTDGAENRRSFLPGLRALKARKNLFFYCESRLEVFLRPGRSPWRADKKRVRRRSAQACAGFGLKALPHIFQLVAQRRLGDQQLVRRSQNTSAFYNRNKIPIRL